MTESKEKEILSDKDVEGIPLVFQAMGSDLSPGLRPGISVSELKLLKAGIPLGHLQKGWPPARAW